MPAQRDEPTALQVLVVDDEPDVRELLAECIRHRGLEVCQAADGAAAIALLQRSPSQFGLVITDLQLPGCDGLEVLRAARGLNPSCAVVIVTGYASIHSAVEAVRLGAYDYVTKPFSMGQVEVILHRLEERRALEAENRRLLRQAGRRESTEGSAVWLARVEAIEARLARVETTLDDLRDRRSSPPVLR
jgi:two-component system NtrC family response regulator